jgi:hypothetical protein
MTHPPDKEATMSAQTRPTTRLHRTPEHTQDPALARPGNAWGPFVRHYLEMVLAMAVGMVVLHPLWAVGLDALGLPGALHHAPVMATVMATDMSLGMAAWMRFRGHSWRPIVEMSATMYLPFAVFLPPVWAGAMSGGAMITAGHLLMLPSMFALMLWRSNEYGHGHHNRSHARPGTIEPGTTATDEALA